MGSTYHLVIECSFEGKIISDCKLTVMEDLLKCLHFQFSLNRQHYFDFTTDHSSSVSQKKNRMCGTQQVCHINAEKKISNEARPMTVGDGAHISMTVIVERYGQIIILYVQE